MVKNLHELKKYLKASLKNITSSNALSTIKKVIRVERQAHHSVPEKEWAFTDILPLYNDVAFHHKNKEILYVKARIINQVNKGEALAMKDISKQARQKKHKSKFYSKYYKQVDTVLKQGTTALKDLKHLKGNPIVYGGTDQKIHAMSTDNIKNAIENATELVDYSIKEMAKP